MISLLLKLIGVNLKTTFGLSVMRDRYLRRKEKLWQPLLILFGVVAGFSGFAYFFLQIAYSLVQTGNYYGQPEIVYTLAILGTQLLLLIMGLFLVISAFYFSDDLSILVPLPIRPSLILVAKLVTVVVNEYLTALFLFVPAAIAYMQLIGGGIAHLASLLVVFLFTPVLPLVIAGLAALALMRVINRRHRDLLMVIASLVFVVLVLGVNFSIQSAVGKNGDPQAILQQLFTSRYGLIEAIGNRFPPAVWATKAVALSGTGEGFLNMAYFLGATAAGLAVLWAIANRLFFGGLIGGDEVIRRRKQLSASELASRTEQNSLFSALFWREWKLFIRTPIFALNGFLGALIMPIAMIFPIMAQGQLRQLLTEIGSGRNAAIATLAIAAMIMFVGSINTIASTSVSREGKFFYISKMIPVPAELQARAKMVHGLIGAVVSAIPMLVAYLWLARPAPLNFLAAALIGLTGTLMGQAVGLYVDMRAPRLKWTNPQQAVKQNFNAVIPMFLMMPIIGLAALLAVKLFVAEWNYGLIYLLFILLFSIPGAIFYRITAGAANRLYHRLDI